MPYPGPARLRWSAWRRDPGPVGFSSGRLICKPLWQVACLPVANLVPVCFHSGRHLAQRFGALRSLFPEFPCSGQSFTRILLTAFRAKPISVRDDDAASRADGLRLSVRFQRREQRGPVLHTGVVASNVIPARARECCRRLRRASQRTTPLGVRPVYSTSVRCLRASRSSLTSTGSNRLAPRRTRPA